MTIDGRPVLSVRDHRRDSAGLVYIYPVVSRRAGGVSVGINLNTNNACNWACRYCQVPGLVRGRPQAVDLLQLQRELEGFLDQLVSGDFLTRQVPAEARRIADIAFSGNGEPTAAPEFAAALAIAIAARSRLQGAADVPIRLITNGSMVTRSQVAAAIEVLGLHGGEVWFKVDRATAAGIRDVNRVRMDVASMARRLRHCAQRAPTWIQTCWFATDGQAPDTEEEAAYLELVGAHRDVIRGVLLYGIARAPLQPGGDRLGPLPPAVLKRFGDKIAACGVKVSVTP